jgi:hypothetical protein
MVGIPTATDSSLNKNIIRVVNAPKSPSIEIKKPNKRDIRAGILLVETNPLIPWSIRSMIEFLDLPFLRFSQVYSIELDLTLV